MKQLRDDQAWALDELRRCVGEGKRRIMMQAPTGYGKTVLAAALIDSALAKSRKVLFTVPAISLVDQTFEMFSAQAPGEIGVIQAQHEQTNWSKPVQVASIQTLQKRKLPDADVALVDEAHRWFKYFETWFLDPAWKNIPIIGMSATPWTKGLGRYYDELIIADTTENLIAKGLLSDFRVFAPTSPDLKGVRTVGGDYHEGDLTRAINKTELVADIIDTWLKLGEHRATLCFAVDRAHAKHLQQQFEKAGVRCGYQDAYTKEDERREIKRQFHNGEIEIVCNVGTLCVGIDWDVRCIIFARPTKSKMLFVQIAGRGLRTAAGKDYCLFLDHSDNHQRLGFVTDIHQDKLHDGRTPVSDTERPIKLPKKCPKCSYLRPPGVGTCPNCGFKAEVISRITPAEGELKELKRKPRTTRKELLMREGRVLIYAQLKWVASYYGYKSGWIAHKFKEIFDEWPDDDLADRKSLQPSFEMWKWIEHTNIKWARSRRADAGGRHA